VAEPVQVRGLLQCGAFSADPDRFPSFDKVVIFAVAQDKLTGERTLPRRRGKELYRGSIAHDGSIKVVGKGAGPNANFRSDFSGQFNNSGDTVLKGQLVGRRGHRECSISFMETAEQLDTKFGLVTANGQQSQSSKLVESKGVSGTEESKTTSPQQTPSRATAQANPPQAIVPGPPPPNPTSVTTPPTEPTIAALHNLTGELSGQIAVLQKMIRDVQNASQLNPTPPALIQQTIVLLQAKIEELSHRNPSQPSSSPEYRTPIRPDDPQSFPTARNVSESYWSIPYYIPGTPEVGDIWILPQVSDTGQLEFKVRFLDPNSNTDKIRAQATLSSSEAEQLTDSLAKLSDWSDTVHNNRIRREFEKRVTCFPTAECPPVGQRIANKFSTELLFHINDEGETNGAFRLNKGLYEETYSFSIKSGRLLWAYMVHVIKEAKLEYQAGSATSDDIDKILQ
jgi:hypothetical protein